MRLLSSFLLSCLRAAATVDKWWWRIPNHRRQEGDHRDDYRAQEGATPGVVKSYSNLSRNHTKEPVDYPQTPPVGGRTTPSGRTAASTPSRSETSTPSTPWSTGQCRSPTHPTFLRNGQNQEPHAEELRTRESVPRLTRPVVASAWGKQLRLNSTNDPRLEHFVSTYSQGPQNPEPGAPCTGGVGSPE